MGGRSAEFLILNVLETGGSGSCGVRGFEGLQLELDDVPHVLGVLKKYFLQRRTHTERENKTTVQMENIQCKFAT